MNMNARTTPPMLAATPENAETTVRSQRGRRNRTTTRASRMPSSATDDCRRRRQLDRLDEVAAERFIEHGPHRRPAFAAGIEGAYEDGDRRHHQKQTEEDEERAPARPSCAGSRQRGRRCRSPPPGAGSGATVSTYVPAVIAGRLGHAVTVLTRRDHRAPVRRPGRRWRRPICVGRQEAHVGDEVGRWQVGLHLFGDRAVLHQRREAGRDGAALEEGQRRLIRHEVLDPQLGGVRVGAVRDDALGSSTRRTRHRSARTVKHVEPGVLHLGDESGEVVAPVDHDRGLTGEHRRRR